MRAVTSVLGFQFSGVIAGIKKNDSLDLGLILADSPVPVAALFTRNLVRAHPVHLSEKRVLRGLAQACLVNSGNANACNGEAGMEAAIKCCNALAQALNIDPEHVLPSSTGVIGQVLPSIKIEAAIPSLVAGLSVDNAIVFADSIRTTDRWRKLATTKIERDGKTATVLAIGKGAGMFHPDLSPAGQLPSPNGSNFDSGDFAGLHATMLVYLLTDAKVASDVLEASLFEAADATFNAATVDGDTSTNDSVFLMASGKSGLEVGEEEFTRALMEVCAPLAKSMVKDGEGAEHAVTITVTGLQNDAEARDIARVIATSPLVKTALTGKDANWGRLLAAAGRAGIPFDPTCATIHIEGVCICRNGTPTDKESDLLASAKMKSEEYGIEVSLGTGPGTFSYITSDLGHSYVDINAGYRS
jgi:glutamate N-acetyltransferase/amino-acid N-acetyltransferase